MATVIDQEPKQLASTSEDANTSRVFDTIYDPQEIVTFCQKRRQEIAAMKIPDVTL